MTFRRLLGAKRTSLAVAVLACGDPQPGITHHPTAENLPPTGGPVIVGDGPFPAGTLSLKDSLAWSETRDALLGARTTLKLGELGLESTGPEVFGLVGDVDMDQDGNLFVLDRRNHQVRIFNAAGEYQFAVGQAGEGPSEFRDPRGVELLAGGLLVVADRGNQLKVFARSEYGYEYARTVRVPLVPEGICSANDRVFVSGWEEDHTIIHEVDVDAGGIVQHFGEGYRSKYTLVSNQLSDGPVACFGAPTRVMYGFQYLPIVRMYDPQQSVPVWAARVSGFAQSQISSGTEPDGRPYVLFEGDDPSETFEGVVRVSDAHALLQSVVEGPWEDDPSHQVESTVRSYLVHVNSGHGALISESLPLIKRIGSDRYVGVYTDPYPAVEVRVLAYGAAWR